MPVKLLLADKSITIQKVVEMLFSGKEYSVTAVSDGDSALSEAARIVPDVVLADVDLPRMDGYSFSARLKQNPALGQTPVILMLSRDDVYDETKGKQAGIVDRIAKPFESQELIGKVKKALTAAPPRLGEGAAAAAEPRPAAPARPAPAAPAPKPRPAVPSDIFDIIQEAPSRAEITRAPAPPEEAVYEVEPEIEMEEPLAQEMEQALPIGEKAREEMRESLGLEEEPAPSVSELESFGVIPVAEEAAPPPRREAVPPRAPARPAVSEEMLRAITEETVARLAQEYFRTLPPPPTPRVSEEMVRRGIEEAVTRIAREVAREVIEKVAWEVIPQLAETMIREEIERLKAETM